MSILRYDVGMSEAKPKRPWFRFHLLTLVLMTLSLGGIMHLNTRNRGCEMRGWPCGMYYPLLFLDSEEATIAVAEGGYWPRWYGPWNTQGVVVNISVGLSFLLTVALVSECLIRRRENRRA